MVHCRIVQLVAVLQIFVATICATNLAIIEWPWGGIIAGQRYTIRYVPEDADYCDFSLVENPSTQLQFVMNIGNSTGGTFQWTVPTDLPNRSDYAIQIRRGRDNNISGQFESSGGPALVVTIKTLYIEPTGRATFATYAAPSFATRTGATQPAQFTGGDSPNTDTRHSTAVKAGIGVGASIGGLLLLGGTFLLGKMATRRGKRENSASDEDFDGKPELEGLGKSSLITVREHELESPTASEMESVDSKHELDAGEKTELEGTGKCEVDGKTTVRYELP